MRYVKFTGWGKDYEQYGIFTDEEFNLLDITNYSRQVVEENAESFTPLSYEDNEEYYWENLFSNWEEVTKEEYEEATGKKVKE